MSPNKKKPKSSSSQPKVIKAKKARPARTIKNSTILSKAIQKIQSSLSSKSPQLEEVLAPKSKSVLRAADRISARNPRMRAEQLATKAISDVQREVERTKYESGQAQQDVIYSPLPQDLPQSYGEDKIVIQVRDPWWVHTYWEVQSGTIDSLRNRFGHEFNGARPILRVYDVSYIIFDGTNANKHFDIDIPMEARNWYIDLGGPGRSWCVDIGFLLPDGRFIMIARSNVVFMPLDGPSWQTDEEWMIPEDLFARLYHLGFGLGPSSPIGKDISQRFRFPVTSMGLFSPSSPMGAKWMGKGAKPFWLVVNTELIVYGATEPDAKVTVKGQPITLNPDGTFSLRFSLPDGEQIIPVRAQSADGADERCVTPIVSKETR